MVTDSIRSRENGDRSSDHRPDRGQVILIGAVALAFIILGVVVVFNGVVYTETLSSADTGQSASSAETTELEVRQGIGCILEETDTTTQAIQNISTFNRLYQNATAESSPAAVDLVYSSGDIGADSGDITLVYESNDLSYERELTINDDDCPRNP